jgi:hypothetical protein
MIFRRSWLVLLLVLHLSFTIKEEKNGNNGYPQ